jgi:4-hydroxythreonine-4-phosphate dehydrogenase
MENNPSGFKDKPVIGITMGDFNGVGPEIIIKTLSDQRVSKLCTPVIYGSGKVFSKYKKLLEIEDFNYMQVRSVDQIHHKKVNLISIGDENIEVNPGTLAAEAGKMATQALFSVVKDLKSNHLDGVVTAPINKAYVHSDEFKYPGHTEFFSTEFNTPDSVMLLVSESLRVAVATGHIPVNGIVPGLTKDLIISKISKIEKTLRQDFGVGKPRIAVLGLNPHAGEDGLLGQEENNIIKPAIEELKNKGWLIYGPYPADGFFGTMQYKKYDAVLAMYHDQGLIPFKTLAFDSGVNFTAGLPIVRTSPDHGTGFSIAGKNQASENSFREALFVAIDIIKNRKEVSNTVRI